MVAQVYLVTKANADAPNKTYVNDIHACLVNADDGGSDADTIVDAETRIQADGIPIPGHHRVPSQDQDGNHHLILQDPRQGASWMALYLLQNQGQAKTAKDARNLVVSAETLADARVFAASHFDNDSSWSDAVATTLAGETLDAASSMVGYVWKVVITGGTQTEDPIVITTTGSGVEDLDGLAAAIVVNCNAHAEIANAAYVAPDLTLAGIADGMGDASVYITVTPPSGNTTANLPFLFGAITHEGIAAAVLEVALVADTEAKPEVLAEI
jgi:hypothetical protein